MKPSPICKTAIISFIIEEALLKLWNLSSNMRKRLQMIIGDKEITVSKYSPKLLVFNGWIAVEYKQDNIAFTKHIKKGVSNYELKTQADLENSISLNGKLRCHTIDFTPKKPFDADLIRFLSLDSNNYDLYSKCSFRRIKCLVVDLESKHEIEQFLAKIRKVDCVYFRNLSLPSLNLTDFKIRRLCFEEINLSGSCFLPFSLEELKIQNCNSLTFKNVSTKIETLDLYNNSLHIDPSYSWISSFKGLKTIIFHVDEETNCFDFFPSSVRFVYGCEIHKSKLDLTEIKSKFPYFIKIDSKMSIQMAETLNIRDINPLMTQTQEEFTFRPRKILVTCDNAEELNKHPELFEKVEEVGIHSNEFNLGFLPEKIKKIELNLYFWKEKLGWEKGFERFEEAEFNFCSCFKRKSTVKSILNVLKTSKKVLISKDLKHLREYYSCLRFKLKS